MYFLLPKTVINCRPLVFLCGPFFDGNDKNERRTILRRSLGNETISVQIGDNNYKVEPFALIVDNLFIDLSENIKLSLVEEIIAACSFKNYIFVDTLSTALELGLFSNSYSNNSATAFLPTDYHLFKPSIGFFVEETIKNSDKITLCKYKNKRTNKYTDAGKKVLENVIAFKGKQLPSEIQKQIDKDFSNDKKKYILSIDFTRNIEEKRKIYFGISSNIITFIIPTNILFYFVSEYNSEIKIHSILIMYLMRYILESENQLISVIPQLQQEQMNVRIFTPFAAETSEVIECMHELIRLIKDHKSTQKFEVLQYKSVGDVFFYRQIFFYQLFNFSREDLEKYRLRFENKAKALRMKHLVINGKSRKITVYSGTLEGYELRTLNNKIRITLESLVNLHPSGFAYRKGHSVLSCVKMHVNNTYFIKIDIKDFFASISKNVMNKVLKAHFCENGLDVYNAHLIYSAKKLRYKYKSKIVDSWDGLVEILSFCFVNDKLPLGLTCSPLLSNIYMNFFDARVSRQFPHLIYTRYSDDILVSSTNPFSYKIILDFIKTELSYLNLEFNKSKTHYLELNQKGDHVKFLGLNIIKSDNENYISVGKKYLINTSILLDKYLNGSAHIPSSIIVGKIKYIKHISERDFQNFKTLFHLKTGKPETVIDKLIES